MNLSRPCALAVGLSHSSWAKPIFQVIYRFLPRNASEIPCRSVQPLSPHITGVTFKANQIWTRPDIHDPSKWTAKCGNYPRCWHEAFACIIGYDSNKLYTSSNCNKGSIVCYNTYTDPISNDAGKSSWTIIISLDLRILC